LDLSPTPDGTEELLVGSIAAVLSGAIFGDHCSPISDTTIMSSLSAGCDHIHHVWSQIPYALTTGIIAALVGYLPAGYGYKWPELYLFAIFLMFLVLFSLGKPVPPAIPKEERVHLS
jgi:Na+/H+ antiporter NhaC